MSIPRVLLCILLPPLAVLDKGCGSILIVFLLTCFGWIPGVIAAIILSKDTPSPVVNVTIGGDSSPPTTKTVPMKSWAAFRAQLPAPQPYEEPATDKQKGYLWAMGLQDEAFLDQLGKWQASKLIESGKAYRPGTSPVALAVAIIFLIIAGLFFIGLRSPRHTTTDTPTAPTTTATPSPTPKPTPTPGLGTGIYMQRRIAITTDTGIKALPIGEEVRIVMTNSTGTLVVESTKVRLTVPADAVGPQRPPL